MLIYEALFKRGGKHTCKSNWKQSGILFGHHRPHVREAKKGRQKKGGKCGQKWSKALPITAPFHQTLAFPSAGNNLQALTPAG